MHLISTPNAPSPAGHYTQAIVHNGLIYVSGQLPIDPKDPKKKPASIEAQTEQALRNVEAILHAAGSSLDLTVQIIIYISDISLWDRINVVYARLLGNHRPARAVVPTQALHYGYQLEIQAIAATAG